MVLTQPHLGRSGLLPSFTYFHPCHEQVSMQRRHARVLLLCTKRRTSAGVTRSLKVSASRQRSLLLAQLPSNMGGGSCEASTWARARCEPSASHPPTSRQSHQHLL